MRSRQRSSVGLSVESHLTMLGVAMLAGIAAAAAVGVRKARKRVKRASREGAVAGRGGGRLLLQGVGSVAAAVVK